jgi:hypothetical protein
MKPHPLALCGEIRELELSCELAPPDIRCSSRETRALVDRCGLPATWVIERQGLVRSASVCSEEACRSVRQMAPQVTLDERVVVVQTRRSEPQVQARAAETRWQCFASRFLYKVPTGPLELVAVSGSVAATLNRSTSWK